MDTPNILHVDLDAFFASVEQAENPALRGRPVIVGSAQENRGVVACASYEARPYGVRAGMPIFEARRLCPHAVYLAGNYHRYAEFSERVFDILLEVSPALERSSPDEGYLDLEGCQRLYGAWAAGPLGRLPFQKDSTGLYVRREDRAVPPCERVRVPEPSRWVSAVAAWLKRVVKARTGLNISIGCAANKLVAKTASDCAKPNGLAMVEPGTEADFFLHLPLARIPGLGHALREKLQKWNVRTVAHARRLPLELLQTTFGERPGLSLYRSIRGRGQTKLQEPSLPRSVSRETTFWHASNDRSFVESMLFYLTERVGNTLRRKALAGRSVHLKLRYHDFTGLTSSRSLREPTDQDQEIFAVARALLVRRWTRTRRVRLVGVGVSGLHPLQGRQSKLFEHRAERGRRLNRCLDRLRDRFGFSVVQRGPSIRLSSRFESGPDGYRLRTPALSR